MTFPDQALRLLPELTLLGGALLCLATGLAPKRQIRNLTAMIAVFAALLATMLAAMPLPGGAVWTSPVDMPHLPPFIKITVGLLGSLLLMVGAKVPDRLRQVLDAEAAPVFEAGDDYRGEFFAFTLVSMAGAMLCAGAGDLIWLLLALELVSLPSYVMIACSRDDARAPEAAIKYFFLGAMAAAVFLFGFALMYGATGHTGIAEIRAYVHAHGAPSPLMLTGVALAVAGIAFKIAAVPMHSYTQDVYEGAATPITAFLAVIPKLAGFAALILVLGTVGWMPTQTGVTPLPSILLTLLTVMAIASMLVGNTLGIVAKNAKRMMGASSIAQSGYLLLGLIAGPQLLMHAAAPEAGADGTGATLWDQLHTTLVSSGGFDASNGIAALLFYLAVYALGTLGVLGALGCLVDPHGHDASSWTSLSGLRHRHPMLAAIIALCSLSLMGLPVLGGFIGKLMIANATLSSGSSAMALGLVVLLVVNSAISAGYYLKLAWTVILGPDNCTLVELPVPSRRMAALVAAMATLAMGGLLAQPLLKAVSHASGVVPPPMPTQTAEQPSRHGGPVQYGEPGQYDEPGQ